MALQVVEEILVAASTPVRDHEAMEAAVMAHLSPVDPVPPRRLAHLMTARHTVTISIRDPYSR